MDKKTFISTRRNVEALIERHRLRDAFAVARSAAIGLNDFNTDRRLRSAEESYRLMLQYASQGISDPSRADMTLQLESDIIAALDELERKVNLAEQSTFYFNTLRYLQTHPEVTIPSLLEKYSKQSQATSLFSSVEAGIGNAPSVDTYKQREGLERTLFNHVWVSYPLSSADTEALQTSLSGERYPAYFRQLLLNAVVLGGLEYFDEQRLKLLLEVYLDASSDLRIYGLIGAGMLMSRWRGRKLSRKILNRLNAARELPEWLADLTKVTMALVRTIDTERVTRKIQDEIVPEMLRLRPLFDKKIKGNLGALDPAELTDMEENPEWQDMMEKSGLADKLKEMSEIQESGGDVMMGTFSHLKSFPFFHEPSNWFLPFHSDFSMFIGGEHPDLSRIADVLGKMPMLCDSDKFSMMFSLERSPGELLDQMADKLNANAEQLAELQYASLDTGEMEQTNRINNMVHNFYRFFNLFRRKGEFTNPFEHGLNLLHVGELATDLHSPETLQLVAEFYFSHGYYSEALEVFRLLEPMGKPDPQVYQKMGYAMQKLGDAATAVEYLEKAEILDRQSDWTLKQLARNLMILERYSQALERFEELERRHPEHVPTIMSVGRCLVYLDRFEEAIRRFYKVEFLDEKSGRALRPLAWSLLMVRDFEKSRKYYDKVLQTVQPIPADYLNMGHLSLAQGDFREALNFYSLNITARAQADASNVPADQKQKKAIDDFVADMTTDTASLSRIGVDAAIVPYLIDSLLYTL